jgi:serine/threonine-protein kinase
VGPGELIGKYRIESKLGEGGNGAVYEARDTVLGRRVALKVLHPRYVHDAELLGRFRAEAAAMARLSHANVVTVFDFVGRENSWAIVMELVENGATLASLLERDGRLSPPRALGLARQVALGLAHAHGKGIVHRDVKPANVLVVRSGDTEQAKVTDFGIARIVDDERRTRGDMTLGTLYYIAPEQAQSSDVDARADVYAFGVMLYEALTGSVPFDYPSPAQVIHAHLGEAPRRPSSRVPGLWTSIDTLVLDCMAKSPADRPADGSALVERIDAILAESTAERAIPRTRILSHEDVPVPGAIAPAGAVPAAKEPSLPSFAAPAAEEDGGGNLLVWIGIAAAIVIVGMCLIGGVLSCVTCAR